MTNATRAEHIASCKQRALEYLERGESGEAVSSMLLDLLTHPETEDDYWSGRRALPRGVIPCDREEVRRWIEGFE